MLVRRYVGSRLRRQQAVDERLQAVGLADDHLRVLGRAAARSSSRFEELRRAADAAQRVLDLVREAADQVAVRLLLLEQPLLARDLQLLVDVAELDAAASRRCVSIGDTVQVRCSLFLPLTPSSISCSVYDAPLTTALAMAPASAGAVAEELARRVARGTSAARARTGFRRRDSRRSRVRRSAASAPPRRAVRDPDSSRRAPLPTMERSGASRRRPARARSHAALVKTLSKFAPRREAARARAGFSPRGCRVG